MLYCDSICDEETCKMFTYKLLRCASRKCSDGTGLFPDALVELLGSERPTETFSLCLTHNTTAVPKEIVPKAIVSSHMAQLVLLHEFSPALSS